MDEKLYFVHFCEKGEDERLCIRAGEKIQCEKCGMIFEGFFSKVFCKVGCRTFAPKKKSKYELMTDE